MRNAILYTVIVTVIALKYITSFSDQALIVTDSNEKSMELRLIFTAKDADHAWNLECLIRERSINFIRQSYPGILPTERIHFNLPQFENEKSLYKKE